MVEVRPVAAGEIDAVIRADALAFGDPKDDRLLERSRMFLEHDRVVGAFEGPALAGAAATLTMRLGTPGGRVPAAGVTWVSVHPLHRRRGVLRSMMRHQLESFRDGGEPVAMLGASESVIYRRFGYGVASRIAPVDIERAHARLVDGVIREGSLELVDVETMLREAPAVLERVAARSNGMVTRSDSHWRSVLHDAGEARDGRTAAHLLLHRDAGGAVDGYARYRLQPQWTEHELADGVVHVSEVVAETHAAYVSIWSQLLDQDLTSRIVAPRRPVEEPLDHLLRDPRRLRRRLVDDLYVRVVDVERALAARRYSRDDAVVLDVADGFCPWVAGRYVLEGGLDGASCTRTDRGADVVVDAQALGAAYLGGTPLPVLAAAGLAEERTPGALARLAAMLAWPEPPYTPLMF